jgi:TRAP-type C4-dicarboxylate transport system permease large subunit
MFFDIFSATVVLVPLVAPAAARLGIDPLHLGTIFLLNLEVGYLTPPVGINLFVAKLRFGQPIAQVYRAALPYLGIMLLVLAAVTYLPELAVR